MKKRYKICYVVKWCNAFWPTYAITLRLRQKLEILIGKTNQSEFPQVKQKAAYVGQKLLYFYAVHSSTELFL